MPYLQMEFPFAVYYLLTIFPSGTKTVERYGRVGDKYEIVDEKVSYTYKNADKPGSNNSDQLDSRYSNKGPFIFNVEGGVTVFARKKRSTPPKSLGKQ